ncbi:MAG: hypothetical protein LBT08_02040 [Synergistaceae bacterium]|nr:hypothetical protein [Synergistaceae bacterium]
MAAKTKDISLDLYITANSPGEIAGWVVPVVREIRAKVWKCRTTLVILPCQYASGAEMSIGASSGVDRCVRLGAFGDLMSGDSMTKARKRLVLHMGGDLFFSVYLSKRLGAALWAYSSRPRWGRFVKFFFVPDEMAERRFALLNFKQDRYERIGALALDSVVLRETEEETMESLRLSPDEPVIAILAGSRPVEYCFGVPYFAGIASRITEKFPDHRVFFLLAATVNEEALKKSLESSGIAFKGVNRVHEIDIGGGRWASVVRDRTLEILNCAKLAITVPGTNNLQAAALYVPYIMVLPLDRADEYPVDGIFGVLPLWIPGFRRLKKNYIMKLNARTEFVSLPNKMAGRMIAPELRGLFPPEEVANKAIELLESPQSLQEMSRRFWDLTHERGAASKLAEKLAKWAKDPDAK